MATKTEFGSDSVGGPADDRNSCRPITEPGHGIAPGRIIQKQRGERRSSQSNVVDVFQSLQKGLEMEPEKRLDSGRAAEPEFVEPFKYAGCLACILSSVTISLTLLCVKLLPVEDCISEKAKAGMFRGLFMMLFCGLTIFQQGLSFKVPRGEYLINLARAVFGGLNCLLAYIAVQFVTMGERSAVSYLYCIWTSLLGFVLLKEPLKLTLLIAIPVSFLGVILIAIPSLIVDPEDELVESDEILDEYYTEHRWIGIMTALMGSFLSSSITIVLKFRKQTPIVVCSFYMAVALVLVSIGVQMIVGFPAMPSTWLEWFLLTCIGFLSVVAQCLFQWSLQYVSAGTCSTFISIEIVTCYLLGVFFLREPVLWTSLGGSAMIILVVILMVFNDRLVNCFQSASSSVKITGSR